MRTLFTILFIAFSTLTFSQTLDNGIKTPFQVVFSDSCYNRNGDLVKNLELLLVDEVIQVMGQLTLLHETGLPVQFNADTTIQLRKLHEIITPPTTQKKKKKRNQDYEYSVSRPKIEKLLLTNGKQTLNPSYIACSDCHYNMKLLCPSLTNQRVYVWDDLTIKWQPIQQDSFMIEFSSIFGDKLKSFINVGTELHMDSATINRILSQDGGIMMTVRPLKESMYQGNFIILKYPFPGQIDLSCNTQSAPIALLMGYFLEMEGKPLRNEAESYYILAARLSKDIYFKDMLDNYYQRKRFYK